MTDSSLLKTHADLQPSSAPVSAALASVPTSSTNGVPATNGHVDSEDTSVIKCVCSYDDDDGHTVLCEKCETWQHILCYYPTPAAVPEIHYCIDCKPRALAVKLEDAKERQRQLRAPGSEVRKKKPTGKGSKKKAKDNHQAIANNGLSGYEHSNGIDHKEDNLRDLPPPAKRTKISHRNSVSVKDVSIAPSHNSNSRQRASSTVHNGHSPVRSPTTPSAHGYTADYFSPEFLKLHRGPEYVPIHANLYNNLAIPKDLSIWRQDPDVLADVTDGKEIGEVFGRYDQPIEDLTSRAPGITLQTEQEPKIEAQGLHPIWRYLTINMECPKDSFIGELKGHIGRKEDYYDDPSNRWLAMRHPEPFVFFHPHLPIYIDARSEGTILRYVRRSCRPNLTMRILITEGTEFHFCFMASETIGQGEEITVGWDIVKEIKQLLSKDLSNGNIRRGGIQRVEQLSQWVVGVLSNFGGCACNLPREECLLARADRRNGAYLPELPTPLPKQRIKKSRKTGAQISPLSTGHATNSRAGSEATNRHGHDDDNADARSASGSSRSKPTSRDNTPLTQSSADATGHVGGGEMSARERRKLMEQERLFEQMEQDEQHGHKRKKRNSAGSALTTPTIANSQKQLGLPDGISSTASNMSSRPRPFEVQKVRNKQSGQRGSGARLSSARSNGSTTTITAPPPVYVERSVQTEPDSPPRSPSVKRKRYCSSTLNLIERLKRNRISREQSQKASNSPNGVEEKSPVPVEEKMDVSPDRPLTPPKIPPSDVQPQRVSTPLIVPMSDNAHSEDIEMKDAPDAGSPQTSHAGSSRPSSSAGPQETPIQGSHPSIQPPPPPWPSSPSTISPDASQATKTSGLHVQLPPPPNFPSHAPLTPSSATPTTSATSILGNPIAQSPSTAIQTPLFSPSITSLVTPSPQKKKLSLSDYTSRKAKQNIESQSTASLNAGPTSSTSPNLSAKQPQTSDSQLPKPTSPMPSHPSPLRTLSQPLAWPNESDEIKPETKTESPPVTRADADKFSNAR